MADNKNNNSSESFFQTFNSENSNASTSQANQELRDNNTSKFEKNSKRKLNIFLVGIIGFLIIVTLTILILNRNNSATNNSFVDTSTQNGNPPVKSIEDSLNCLSWKGIIRKSMQLENPNSMFGTAANYEYSYFILKDPSKVQEYITNKLHFSSPEYTLKNLQKKIDNFPVETKYCLIETKPATENKIETELQIFIPFKNATKSSKSYYFVKENGTYKIDKIITKQK